jgi:hypothetical protein
MKSLTQEDAVDLNSVGKIARTVGVKYFIAA